MTALNGNVLVLNQHWLPHDTIDVKTALKKMCVGVAEAIHVVTDSAGKVHYEQYDFDSWAALSEYREAFEANTDGVQWITTSSSLKIPVPKIIRMINFKRYISRPPRLTRHNVMERDNYTCQYTGKKLPPNKLNIDHVIPVSQGGKTTWDNLVACSVEINEKKADRRPEQCGLKLIRKPQAPKHRLSMPKIKHDCWQHFVDAAYWNTELKD